MFTGGQGPGLHRQLQENPDAVGLDLKRPQGGVDKRVGTARVNDSWRAALFDLPERGGYVLASVKPHDDSYSHAARVRLDINSRQTVERSLLFVAGTRAREQLAMFGVGDLGAYAPDQ